MRAIRQLQKVNSTSIERIAKSLHKSAASRMMSLLSSEESTEIGRRYTSNVRNVDPQTNMTVTVNADLGTLDS